MGKPEQFLWIVQTLMIRNAIFLAQDAEKADEYKNQINSHGAFAMCDDAIYASQRIPEDLSAAKAAEQFFDYMAKNIRDEQEAESGKRMEVPGWFARGS